MSRAIVLSILFIFGLVLGQTVPEDSLKSMLDRAKKFYYNGEYENAIKELENALLHRKQFKDSEQAEVYKYLGFSYVAFGDNRKARVQFKKALGLNPALELDPATVSPKIIKVFEEARAEMKKTGSPPKLKPVKKTIPRTPAINTFRATMRSCLVPGWGQLYKGESGKAKRMMIISAGLFGSTAVSLLIRESTHNAYRNVPAGNKDEMDSKYQAYKIWHNASAFLFIASAGFYFYNIYDVVFTKIKPGTSMRNPAGLYCGFSNDRFGIGYNINF